MAQQKCSVKLGTSVFPPIQLLERNCRTSKRQKYFKQYSIRGIFMLAGNMVFHENKKSTWMIKVYSNWPNMKIYVQKKIWAEIMFILKFYSGNNEGNQTIEFLDAVINYLQDRTQPSMFQSNSTLYSCLNVKELLAQNRCNIWSLSCNNRIQTNSHLVCKQKLNNLAKLVWSACLWISGCGFESCCCHFKYVSQVGATTTCCLQ